MRIKLGFSAVILSVLLAACATPPSSIAPATASTIKRLSAISVSGDRFRRLYVGLTVFGNEYDERPIPDWGLDSEYEAQIELAAKKVFTANYVKVAYSRADFIHANDLNGPYDAPAFWGPNWSTIQPYVKSVCAHDSLDALLVVAARETGDIFGGTNQSVIGAGIYTRGRTSILHYLAAVSLYECKTAKVLATRNVGRNGGARAGTMVQPPAVDLPEVISRVPTSQWTPEIEQQIRSILLELPKAAWDDTLGAMVQPR